MVEVREGTLLHDGAAVDPRRVIGFHERYDALTGRAWLEVVGPGLKLPMGGGYGSVRKSVRAAYPDRPFTSDWADGRFPSAPLGAPSDLVFAAGALLTTALACVATAWLGALAGAGVAVALAWPVVRLRDAVVVRREGIAAGPPWAPIVPWHEVQAVHAVTVGRQTFVRVVTASGAGDATLPSVLLPAVKARVSRLGGLATGAPTDAVDWTYRVWRAPALGIPWGVLIGALVVAPLLDRPWRVVAIGLLASSATALLGAGVSARANGWGTGGVLAITGVYAIVIGAFGLALGGW